MYRVFISITEFNVLNAYLVCRNLGNKYTNLAGTVYARQSIKQISDVSTVLVCISNCSF